MAPQVEYIRMKAPNSPKNAETTCFFGVHILALSSVFGRGRHVAAREPRRRLDQAWLEDWAGDGMRAAALGASGSSNWPIMVSGTGVEVP
jgi:hypothetical protein